MSADCAIELRSRNVACVSLWPGAVLTEGTKEMLDKKGDEVDVDTGARVWGKFTHLQSCSPFNLISPKQAHIWNFLRTPDRGWAKRSAHVLEGLLLSLLPLAARAA